MKKKENCNCVRPSGHLNVHDPRGYAYLPNDVKDELGVDGKGRIPYFKDANCVLLVRPDASRSEVLEGLKVLKMDIKLRWKEVPQKP